MTGVGAPRTAIVTGGASGIGRALAAALARRGVTVLVADRDGTAAAAVAAEPRASGATVEAARLDVTDRDAVQRAVDAFAVAHGRLDYVFNNAGVGVAGEVRDLTADDWDAVLAVNLRGVVHGVQAAYPRFVRQGFGHLVNTASVAGLVPLPGEVPYVASKYAVVGLSHALRAEGAALGVRVSVVCPGVVHTPIYDTSPVRGLDKDAALALWPRGISAEACARRILRGVDRNQATIVVTAHAHVLWRMARLAPGLYLRGAEAYMKRVRRARTEAG